MFYIGGQWVPSVHFNDNTVVKMYNTGFAMEYFYIVVRTILCYTALILALA